MTDSGPNTCRLKRTDNSININCDQVSWLLDIFYRYVPRDPKEKGVSKKREMLAYGMLYEVMEIANLHFADDSARWNGTPDGARKYPEETEARL